jgi:hypothetical protein
VRRFDDLRYADRLLSIEAIAEPHLANLGLVESEVAPAPGFRAGALTDPALLERAAAIPRDAIPAVRVALLRRVVESELGTAESPEGHVRTTIATLVPLEADDLALELALCAHGIDLGFGISLAWLRLSVMDPTLIDLDHMDVADGSDPLADEAASLADVLANDTMILDAGATDRRIRLLATLERLRPGAGAAVAFDPGDPFGETMRTLVETDAGLARPIGRILPIAARATSVLPGRGQRSSIAAVVDDEDAAGPVRDAVVRVVHQLVTAPLRPRGAGFVTVRPSNQRLGRAVAWLIPSLLPRHAAHLLGELGLRMGTSGAPDSQARDAAIAGTCAAMLGYIADDDAIASLARMRARVRNKTVRKQVDKALATAATRDRVSVERLLERSLPSYGLDTDGRRMIPVGTWSAEISVAVDGHVAVNWSDRVAGRREQPPSSVRELEPGAVAEVLGLAEDIRATLRDERQRLEGLLAEERRWPIADWAHRFVHHPLGRVHGQRLIWRFTGESSSFDAIVADGIATDREGVSMSLASDWTVELWHPVEAPDDEVDRWREAIVAARIAQPCKQAFRETYRVDRRWGADGMRDTRFADRPLAYGQMRALLTARGWTAPMLGPFEGGDRAVAFRSLVGTGLHAEFDHEPAGLDDPRDRVDYVRSGSVRFTTETDEGRSPVLLADVPVRAFSEALRDVDLFTSVPDLLRPSKSTDVDPSPSVATRADAVRRLLPTLGWPGRASVLGGWLRIESATGAWAISLATASAMRLPDEEVATVGLPASLPDVGYLPIDDDILRSVFATVFALTGWTQGRP